MSKVEEEKKIAGMLEAGHTFPEIAEVLHKSITTISEVKDRLDAVRLPKEKDRASEAYRLYKEGMNSLDVAIELGIDANESKKYFVEFLDLINADELENIYLDIGQDIRAVLDLYKTLKDQGLTIDQILSLRQLPAQINQLINQRTSVNLELYQLNKSVDDLSIRKDQLQNKVIHLTLDVKNLNETKLQVSQDISSLKLILNSIRQGDISYQKIEQIATDSNKSFMNSQSEVLVTALASTILALKNDPLLTTLFLSPYSGSQYPALLKSYTELALRAWDNVENHVKTQYRLMLYKRVMQMVDLPKVSES
jgi:hypothetical protein